MRDSDGESDLAAGVPYLLPKLFGAAEPGLALHQLQGRVLTFIGLSQHAGFVQHPRCDAHLAAPCED
eukprot:6803596-Alexandrium_andersonii.AAC.1